MAFHVIMKCSCFTMKMAGCLKALSFFCVRILCSCHLRLPCIICTLAEPFLPFLQSSLTCVLTIKSAPLYHKVIDHLFLYSTAWDAVSIWYTIQVETWIYLPIWNHPRRARASVPNEIANPSLCAVWTNIQSFIFRNHLEKRPDFEHR